MNAKKVVVIGAGTMGSGIAAHMANIGFEVSLLDLTRESCNALFDRARTARPPHFLTQDRANSVRRGGIDQDLQWVGEADWVCEAIIEKLDAKRDLFALIEPLLREDAMISTNTSGLQIELLNEGRSESWRKRFLGTHFFNPPRYLKLLELIPTGDTAPEAIAAFTQFLEEKAARRVVLAKDTPGFIANRYGMWSMIWATHVAEELHLSPEAVDLITGQFLGRPRTGSFRLNDLVGLDIMVDIAQNLQQRCPHDPRTADLATPRSIEFLMSKGWIGEKSGHGFYRRENKELLTFDPVTQAYRERVEPSIPSVDKHGKLPLGQRIAATLKERDEAGEFLREYLIPTLKYATEIKEEISHNVLDFDRVMEWGFGWQMGPFAMIDAIGPENLGFESPTYYQSGQVLSHSGEWQPRPTEPHYLSIKGFPVIEEKGTYALVDLGDRITGVVLRTKMGSISPELVRDLTELFTARPDDRFVLCNDGRCFSVGYDLRFFDERIDSGDMKGIDAGLAELHALGELMEQRRVVAAVHGYCFGAGLELALSCPKIVTAVDAQIGLPEAKVGLLPGGRGTVLMRLHSQGSIKRCVEVAMNLIRGESASNAEEARILGYLRPTDQTVYHPDRLVFEAIEAAKKVEPTGRPGWMNLEGPISGMIDREIEQLGIAGKFSEHDRFIGDRIRMIFSKSSSYASATEMERREFLELCGKALTHARIRHMLQTGKPLPN
jgi:3-hydroxyacyl-CoA dehydrogenase